MDDYSKALELYWEALAIQQKLLSSNHPDLAATMNLIDMLYEHLRNEADALRSNQHATSMIGK